MNVRSWMGDQDWREHDKSLGFDFAWRARWPQRALPLQNSHIFRLSLLLPAVAATNHVSAIATCSRGGSLGPRSVLLSTSTRRLQQQHNMFDIDAQAAKAVVTLEQLTNDATPTEGVPVEEGAKPDAKHTVHGLLGLKGEEISTASGQTTSQIRRDSAVVVHVGLCVPPYRCMLHEGPPHAAGAAAGHRICTSVSHDLTRCTLQVLLSCFPRRPVWGCQCHTAAASCWPSSAACRGGLRRCLSTLQLRGLASRSGTAR